MDNSREQLMVGWTRGWTVGIWMTTAKYGVNYSLGLGGLHLRMGLNYS